MGPVVLGMVATGCGFLPRSGSGDQLPPPDSAVTVAPPDVAPTGPYPIVLAHGLFGFSSIGPLDYFYGIGPALTAQGRAVFAPQVDAIQSSDVRGAELVLAIEAARAQTGASKVIVIGHSQGGLDARWAAAHDPDSIAAVVTVATPHRGSKVADVALGVLPGNSSAALDALANLFGISGSGASFAGAVHLLSTDGAAQFNADVPDVPGMPYFSIAGRSLLAGQDACPPAAAQFMTTWNGARDPIKAELAPVAGMLALAELPNTPTQDGLVTRSSATWGQFLGCIPADHFDEVCQLAGQGPGLGNDFNCLDFWRDLEQFLTSKNL
ncbi:lipase LipC [soil metagenome]